MAQENTIKGEIDCDGCSRERQNNKAVLVAFEFNKPPGGGDGEGTSFLKQIPRHL